MSFLDFQRDKRAKPPAEVQDSSSVISAVPVVRADRTDPQRQGHAQQVEVVTANDVLARAFDATRLHPLAGIGDQGQLDYLLLDDDKLNALPGAQTALPSRGWTDDLCYGTGTTYLTGLGVGGLWGLREGAARPLAVSNTRLRLNSVLNGVTRRGTFLGNSAGVLALIYNIVNSSIDSWRGKHDIWGGMAAGGLCGAVYKSTAGVKPAIAAATLMSSAAGIWGWLKSVVL